jgi:hypothetical protein
MGFHPSAYMEPPTPRTLIGLVEFGGGGRERGGTLHRPPVPAHRSHKHDQDRGEYHSPAKLTDPFLTSVLKIDPPSSGVPNLPPPTEDPKY